LESAVLVTVPLTDNGCLTGRSVVYACA
jgi:hypothetical protein